MPSNVVPIIAIKNTIYVGLWRMLLFYIFSSRKHSPEPLRSVSLRFHSELNLPGEDITDTFLPIRGLRSVVIVQSLVYKNINKD